MVIVPSAAGAGVPPVDPSARVTVRPVQGVDPSLPGTSSNEVSSVQQIARGYHIQEEPAPPGCKFLILYY